MSHGHKNVRTTHFPSMMSTIDFSDYMNYICNDLQVNIPIREVGKDSRIFLWDNLVSHCAPMIHQTVEG